MRFGARIIIIIQLLAVFKILAQERSDEVASQSQLDSLYTLSWQALKQDAQIAEKYAEQFMELARTHEDSIELGYAYVLKGLALYYQNKNQKAVRFFKEAIQVFNSNQDSVGLSQALVNMGLAYNYMGNYEGAIQAYRRSYEIDTLIEEESGKMFYYSNLGAIYLEQRALSNAERCIDIALKLAYSDTLHPYLLPTLILDKADLLLAKGDLERARDTIYKGLKTSRQFGDSALVSRAYSQLAYYHRENGQFEEAVNQLKNAFSLDTVLGDPYNIALDYGDLAETYRQFGDLEAAMKNIEKAKSIADSEQVHILSRDIYKTYSEILNANGRSQEALAAYKRHQAAKDSINSFALKERIMALDAQILQSRLNLLNTKQEIQERELEEKNLLILVTLAFLLLALTFIVLLRQNRRKVNRYNELLKQRNQDIFEKQKTLNKQSKILHEKNNDLQKLNQSKDRLFSILAHDLKQPFNQILSVIELLEHDLSKNKDELELIEALKKSVSQTSDIVNNLLIWGKAQFAGVSSKKEKINVSTALKKEILQFSVVLDKKSIGINIEVDRGLHIKFDRDHLAIIFRNLLHNAYKFSPQGSEISVKAIRHDEVYAEITISDQGAGMTAEKVKMLLKDTVSISTVGTLNETGTGLGLQIVKQFLAENDSQLRIFSQPGEGSSFSILVPLFVPKTLSDVSK